MRILICGDVVGKSGRDAVHKHLPHAIEKLDVDFTIVNGENAAHGYGITRKICDGFFDLGVDAITTGNHVWKQKEIISWIGEEPRVLRPLNFPEGTPGKGATQFEARGGQRIMVVHPMGRQFMEPSDDPFAAVDDALRNYRLGKAASGNLDAIVVDIHAEATSEKMGMAHYLDGRVSAVVGTHTHIPTADAQILPGGTAFQTDLGMCGDYNSVIGMKKEAAIERFTTRMP
ncbi:MAG: YmdB family metallophosphoesterase, partial [Rhodospirillales bacterium]|nr:YmdB family metallophosphoesterase [Rhodospirillales bacterium]